MGGHDGHHHAPAYKVPNASIYKVEEVPQLLEVQNKLARRGLKDPWLRNEVWRYNPQQFSTHANRARKFFLRGFGIGFAAFLVTIGIEHLTGYDYSHGNYQGHGHGHGHDGHGDK